MNARFHMDRRGTGRVVRGVAFLLSFLGLSAGMVRGAGPASDGLEDRTAGTESSRTALVVFVDYQDYVDPGVPAGELRISSAKSLAVVLEGSGHQIFTYPEIEPLMRRWGMRSPLDLPSGFLRELRSENSIDHLVVAQLVIHRDRALLLARGLESESGELDWTSAAEAAIDPDFWSDHEHAVQNWNELVTGLGEDLETRWSRDPAETEGPTLVLFPAESIGLAEESAALTTHALLGALLESRQYRIPDPGLVRDVLTSRGHDPSLLDRAGRAELTARFAPSALLVPAVVSFGAGPANGATLIEEFAFDDDRPPVSASRSPLYLQVLAVACDGGQVEAAESAYLEPDDPAGLFGILRRVPLSRRFEAGARQIVQRLQARGGSI